MTAAAWRRNRQPQARVGIDRGNPITRGLVTVVRSDQTGPYNDLVGVNNGAASATLAVSQSSKFQGRRFPGSAYIDLGNNASLYPTEFTLLSVFFVDNSNPGGNQDLFSTHWSQTGYVLGVGSGSVNFTLGSTGGWVTASRAIVGGVPYAAVATNSSTSQAMALYVDGQKSTASYSGYSYSNGAQNGYIGDSQLYGNFVTGVIALTALWSRALTDSEARSLSENPWQLFAPQRTARIYSFPTAGGGTTVAVPAGAITLTGFAPTVAFTAHQTIAVPKGALVLSAFAPTVSTSAAQTIAVPLASLTLTGFAPTVAATAHQTISVPAASLTLTAYAPTVYTTAVTSIAVPKGTLTLAGYAPTINYTTNATIGVPAGALTLTGYAPTVIGGTSSVWTQVSAASGTWTPASLAPGTWTPQ